MNTTDTRAVVAELFATVPTPIAPRTSPLDPGRDAVLEMDDLTTDELAKARRGIEQRKRDRNRTPRDPTPPEAA